MFELLFVESSVWIAGCDISVLDFFEYTVESMSNIYLCPSHLLVKGLNPNDEKIYW